MFETVVGGILVSEIAKAWKADDLQKKSLAKNSAAFGKQAEAIRKIEIHEGALFEKMQINAVRKNAILQFHLQKFIDVYRMIAEYKLNDGLGIEEMKNIDFLKKQLKQEVSLPAIAKGIAKSDKKLIMEYSLYGLGGLLYKEAKENRKQASRNMANANVVAAQADSICMVLNGIAQRVQICTELLQKLAAKDIVALNYIEKLLEEKGCDEESYTQKDIDAINLCSELNILIFKIINTPLLDENNEVTKESKLLIEKGQYFLEQLR